MQRTISSKKYLLAFILTLIIFSGGIFIGTLFENARLNSSEKAILNEKVSLQSLQLQQKYIDSGLADCNILNQILENNINDLGRKMAQVIEYERNSFFNQDKFDLQLQDYFLTEIQYLLLAQEIDLKCEKDNLKVVYFYNENEQDTQGDILGYVRKLFDGKVLIFSLDSTFIQEPMINILLTSHNITQFPAIVIGDQIFQGHQNVEQVLKSVCAEFSSMEKIPEQCVTLKQKKII